MFRRGQEMLGGVDINEDHDFDRFVTVDGQDTDDEGVEDQGGYN